MSIPDIDSVRWPLAWTFLAILLPLQRAALPIFSCSRLAGLEQPIRQWYLGKADADSYNVLVVLLKLISDDAAG